MKEGDVAPDFSLPDQEGKPVSLASQRGKWVVLYFYPKDDTPGCTIEAMSFTKYAADFEKLGAKILGVSKDTCESHMKFARHRSLGITILSDPETSVLQLYGVWKKQKFLGREFLGTARTTFLISPEGKIAKVWEAVNPMGHAQAVLETLKGMVG